MDERNTIRSFPKATVVPIPESPCKKQDIESFLEHKLSNEDLFEEENAFSFNNEISGKLND